MTNPEVEQFIQDSKDILENKHKVEMAKKALSTTVAFWILTGLLFASPWILGLAGVIITTAVWIVFMINVLPFWHRFEAEFKED